MRQAIQRISAQIGVEMRTPTTIPVAGARLDQSGYAEALGNIARSVWSDTDKLSDHAVMIARVYETGREALDEEEGLQSNNGIQKALSASMYYCLCENGMQRIGWDCSFRLFQAAMAYAAAQNEVAFFDRMRAAMGVALA